MDVFLNKNCHFNYVYTRLYNKNFNTFIVMNDLKEGEPPIFQNESEISDENIIFIHEMIIDRAELHMKLSLFVRA